MQFPFRDLTNQYISLSYHDVVQRYAQGTASYFLDGLGNVIAFVPTSSLGQQLVTADQLVFINGSSSWASASLSSSHAQYADTASLTIYTQQVVSASYASHSYTSDTASFVQTARIAYYAFVAEVAETASIALLTVTASHSEIADFSYHSVTSDYALSASTALHANVADFALGSQIITGSMTNEEFDLLFCSQSGGSVPVYQDADHSIRYNPALGRLTADHITTTTLTASYIYGSITNATNADTASLATYSEFAGSASYALESTFSDTASLAYYADYAGSASYAISASRAEIALSASWAPMPATSDSASWASSSVSSSHADIADSASYYPPFPTFPDAVPSASWVSASAYIIAADTASYVATASYYPPFPSAVDSASWASSSISASHALVADVALNVSETSSYLVGSAEISGTIRFDISSSTPPHKPGQLFWDNNADTLALHVNDPDVTLQIGQESWLRAIADVDIPNGAAVYIHNALGGFPCIDLALADGYSEKYRVVGVATEFIASGSIGVVTTLGQVHDLDLSAFNVGDQLWLSPTQTGSYTNVLPNDPYQKVSIGYVLDNASGSGAMQVDITALPSDSYPFVGMTTAPTLTTSSVTPTGSIINIGEGKVNLCTTADGLGHVLNYTVPSASFALTASFLDAQYIVATYNSGSPIYQTTTNRSSVDSVQTTIVCSFLMGAGGAVSYVSWDAPGVLLANKDYLRVQALRGIEREYGLDLGVTGSATTSSYITVSAGRAWQGIRPVDLPAVNSTGSRFVLVAHSASVWSGSFITSSIFRQYDNGTDLATLVIGDYVVNWVYRAIGNQNTTIVQLGPNFQNLPDAVASQPPTAPPELHDVAFLTGRLIMRNTTGANSVKLMQVDSAYAMTFAPAGITDHNSLNNLQGGVGGEYYHLSSASYSSIVMQGSSSHAQTASIANAISFVPAAAISASWVSASVYIVNADTASYVGGYNVDGAVAYATNAGNAATADTASFAWNADTASYANQSNFALTASYAFTSSYEMEVEISSSWASSSISSSYAITASNLEGFNYINTGSWISILNTDTPVIQVDTGSYDAAFFDYVAMSGSNTRAGMVFGSWVNGQINYTEVSNVDIGDTSKVTMSLALSTSIIQLIANVTDTTPWKIKALARYL